MISLRRSPDAEPAAKPEKFEKLLERLEQIVSDMESAELPLEKLLSSYEEGMRLVKACGDRLADAEQKVEILSKGAALGPASASANPVSSSVSAPLASASSDTKLTPAPGGEDEIRLI
jgi:exodeoxyribonuclease VII small subunit